MYGTYNLFFFEEFYSKLKRENNPLLFEESSSEGKDFARYSMEALGLTLEVDSTNTLRETLRSLKSAPRNPPSRFESVSIRSI